MKERATISALEPAVRLSERERKRITWGLTIGIFVSALEMTVVAAAMPTVAAHLGGFPQYSWIFSAFLFASTITLPVWGKLSDLYGRKRFYLLGLALFLLGSVLAGQSRTIGQLIAFRVVQGLGAGALIPLGLTIAGEVLSFEERARKQALFSSAWGIASVVGPIIGGYVTEHLSWRWVFYLGVPFGGVAALLVGGALPTETRRRSGGGVSIVEILALIGASLSLLLLLEGHFSMRLSKMLLALLVVSSIILFKVGRRNPDSLIPAEFFRERTMGLSLLVSWLTGMVLLGALGFFPLFVQGALGGGPSLAGRSLLPIFLSWVIFSILASRLTLRVGFRPIIVVAMLVLLVGFSWLTPVGGAPALGKVLGALALIGMGMGLSNVTILLLVQYSVPSDHLGRATALVIFLRSLGGAIGANLLGTITTWRLRVLWSGRGEHMGVPLDVRLLEEFISRRGAVISPIPSEALQHILGRALQEAFVLGGIVAALALLAALFLPKGRTSRREERSESSLYPVS
jgi:EmrB/QacA subfamily drug resistance transporter